MSYAQNLARVDPVHGLFAASIPGFLYAILGTCSQLSVGPEAALSLLVGQTVSQYTSRLSKDAPPERIEEVAIAVSTMITLQVGLVTFALGIFRLGFLDSVLSRPLLRGFITAVGLIILLEQLVPLLGLQIHAKAAGFMKAHMLGKIVIVLQNLKHTHYLTLALSCFSAGSLIAVRIMKPRLVTKHKSVQFVPEILLLVIGASL
jgi:MFS superfamily sulfate permease-like transporter